MNFVATLEDYLQEVHAKQYTGTDDDMPDDFDNWIVELDPEEVMRYADEAIAHNFNVTKSYTDKL